MTRPAFFGLAMLALACFAGFDGERTVQVATIGPWGITYVNPADDPRKK